jgi:hypothetical protein
MRKYFTLGLIGVLMIVLTQSAVPPLTRQAHAHKELPKWVTYKGNPTVFSMKYCQPNLFRCFNLPEKVCVNAKDHPSVCPESQGVMLIDELKVGYCKSILFPQPGDFANCVQYTDLTTSYAICYSEYDPGMNPSCRGNKTEILCTIITAQKGPGWTCLPDYTN